MKKKLIIFLSILLLLSVFGVIYYKLHNQYDGNYQIKIEKFDDKSPYWHLIVLKDGKATEKYDYIKYNDDSGIVVCKSTNPTANIYDLDIDELVIVLLNKNEIVAKVIKEEK